MSAVETDLWVFRDGRKSVRSVRLLDELQASLKKLLDSAPSPIHDRCLNALIRVGEVESARADADCPSASTLASITDVLASSLLSGELSWVRKHMGSLSKLSLP